MAQTSFYAGAAPQFAFLGTKRGFAGYPTIQGHYNESAEVKLVLMQIKVGFDRPEDGGRTEVFINLSAPIVF
uniref:Omp85 domain-containing protein n=1 Tax=Rhabditophanes sp. KR3021 TaxID=114890 RepID=A0AC35TN00_9BILA